MIHGTVLVQDLMVTQKLWLILFVGILKDHNLVTSLKFSIFHSTFSIKKATAVVILESRQGVSRKIFCILKFPRSGYFSRFNESKQNENFRKR